MFNQRKTGYAGIMLLLLLSMPGCDEVIETTGPSAVSFAVMPFQVPQQVNTLVPPGSNPRSYDIAFSVSHPDGNSAISAVTAQFYSADRSQLLAELPLYDDGSVVQPGDRDVIANDGIYTNTFTINSIILAEGDYSLRAVAGDAANDSKMSDWLPLSAISNVPPRLLSVQGPDTLASGAGPAVFTATVQDSNTIADVTTVQVTLARGGSEIASLPMIFQGAAGDDRGTFTLQLDSAFAAERIGDYTLEFQARDNSDERSAKLSRPFFLENGAPRLFNLSLPDTVFRPATNELAILLSISADDPQGLSDIDSVYFNSILPSGNPATNNPFPVYDNGLPFDPGNNPEAVGDLVEGDGIYSRTILVFNNTTTGKYTFSFFTRDKVGNFTVGAVDSIFILP